MWWKTTGHWELYRLLMLWWDPIGVKDIPEAQGEYTGYAGTLGRMLYEDTPEAAIAEFLAQSEERMGLAPSTETDSLVASKLLDWYAQATRDEPPWV
jgi:hypothetical protein